MRMSRALVLHAEFAFQGTWALLKLPGWLPRLAAKAARTLTFTMWPKGSDSHFTPMTCAAHELLLTLGTLASLLHMMNGAAVLAAKVCSNSTVGT